jgi:response regulator RpfG family c-di-GMP phosphodiesterase
MKYKIMVVDDESANLRLLERLLSPRYEVFTAESGVDALELVGKHHFALIISDQRMPGMTGIELLKRAEAIYPLTVRIILTGYTDAEALVDAINSGVVYKYVTKPWINSDLQLTVQRGLQHYETLKAQRTLQESYTRLLAELDSAHFSFIRFAAGILHLRDSNAHARAGRLCKHAVNVAREMGLSTTETDRLQLAIYVKGVLNLPGLEHSRGAMTPAMLNTALSTVQKFEAGMRTMSEVPYLSEVLPLIRHFSERYDGNGFPNKLAGDGIPVGCRIGAVVFSYDELVSPRDEARPLGPREAIRKLQEAAGTKYDPTVLECFSQAINARSSLDAIQKSFQYEARTLPARVSS